MVMASRSSKGRAPGLEKKRNKQQYVGDKRQQVKIGLH
jgi:hypothetical protein